MDGKIKYEFLSKIWRHGGQGGWHFVSMPNKMSAEIRKSLKWQEEGWGRMKCFAQIRESSWETAIWFDTCKNTYILPIKSAIRQKCSVNEGSSINIAIWI